MLTKPTPKSNLCFVPVNDDISTERIKVGVTRPEYRKYFATTKVDDFKTPSIDTYNDHDKLPILAPTNGDIRALAVEYGDESDWCDSWEFFFTKSHETLQ